MEYHSVHLALSWYSKRLMHGCYGILGACQTKWLLGGCYCIPGRCYGIPGGCYGILGGCSADATVSEELAKKLQGGCYGIPGGSWL